MRPLNLGGRQGRGDPPFAARTRTPLWLRLVRRLRGSPVDAFFVLIGLWLVAALAWEAAMAWLHG